MLPYLIALDDVIDLPQVVAATCSVADLQQHRAYFLLSQFSRSRCALPSSLKSTEGGAEKGKGGGVEGGKCTVKQRERERDDEWEAVMLHSHKLWLRGYLYFILKGPSKSHLNGHNNIVC